MKKWYVLIVMNLFIPRINVLNWLVTQNVGKTAELASNAIKLGVLQYIVPKMTKIEKFSRKKVMQRRMVYSQELWFVNHVMKKELKWWTIKNLIDIITEMMILCQDCWTNVNLTLHLTMTVMMIVCQDYWTEVS